MVGSGSSTFCKKRGLRKWKTSENQDLYLYFILKTEKRKPFFNFHSLLWKPEKSAPFPHEKQYIFRTCLRYKVNELSWVIFTSHQSQKSWKEKSLEFFQLCAFFFKVRKVDFFNQWSVLAILLFAKNADNENKKYLKIKVILYISHSKQKKRIPFFNFHSPLWKPEKSAPFSHEKPDIFRICLRYKLKQLSWVIFISH